MISLLLTLILSFASDSCNNKDIILILGYNYNLVTFCNSFLAVSNFLMVLNHWHWQDDMLPIQI